jgi:cell division septum initiation protein DivIVA
MSAGQDHLPAPGSAFAVTRRGYDPVQVDDYLRHLDAQLRMLAADRDAAVEQNGQLTRQVNVAWAETDRLKVQMRRLSAPPESVEGMSERLQSMLRLAQDEVAERRKRAEIEAAEIVARAEAQAGELPRQNEAIRRQLEHERKQLTFERNKILSEAREEADLIHSRATAEGDRIRSEANAEIAALRKQADEERRTLDEQGKAQRAQIEEDFEIAMSARRAEAMATIHGHQAACRDEANRLLASARAEAERKIVEAQRAADAAIQAAEQRVAELDGLRARMASQLAELHSVLDAVLPRLDGADGELPTHPAEPFASPTLGGSAVAHAGNGDRRAPAPLGTEDQASGAVPAGASANGTVVEHIGTSTDAETHRGAASARDAAPPATTIELEATDSSDVGAPSPGEESAAADPTPTPRSSPEVRPSPRSRRPTPAGRQL